MKDRGTSRIVRTASSDHIPSYSTERDKDEYKDRDKKDEEG